MRPVGYRYTTDHEWIRVDGEVGVVGITDFAVEQLRDLVYVELPEVGRSVAKGEAIGEIESVKTVAELFAPVSGVISEVNSSLEDDLDAVNRSPFEDGWMIKMELSDPGELDGLLDKDAYDRHVEAESH